MHVETLVLGELATNCYLVWDETTREAIVIDPADSGDVISQKILEEELTLRAIVLTHGHFDHVLGLLELKLNFVQTPILMHQADLFLLEKAQQSALHWLGRQVDPVPPPDRFLNEGDEIELGEERFIVLEAPGHTPGSICLYNDEVIFTGDVLFKDGIGRTDFSYSNPGQMKESLSKLKKIIKKQVVYSGHGEAFKDLVK